MFIVVMRWDTRCYWYVRTNVFSTLISTYLQVYKERWMHSRFSLCYPYLKRKQFVHYTGISVHLVTLSIKNHFEWELFYWIAFVPFIYFHSFTSNLINSIHIVKSAKCWISWSSSALWLYHFHHLQHRPTSTLISM